MEKNRLDRANSLNERIKQLSLLRMYLDVDKEENPYYWHDFIRLFLPKKMKEKLHTSGYDEMYDNSNYDTMFAKDVIETIDFLIDKYSKMLEEL